MASVKEWISLLRIMNRYKEGFAHYKGRLDAKHRLPPTESEQQIAERICKAYDSVRQAYPDFKCSQDRQDIQEYLRQKQRRYLGYLAELRNLGEEIVCNKIAEMLQIDSALKSQWCHFESCREEAEKDLKEFDRIFPNYISRVSLASWAYYLLLILIGFAELPLNMVAFQLFGEAQLMTLAVALALALVIPACAHWVGAVIKQPFRTSVDRWILIATCFIVLLAIVGIGLIREAYLRHMGEEVVQAVTLVFIGIQLTLFVGGIIASYNAHDLRHDLARHLKELEIAANKIRKKRIVLREATEASIKGYQDLLNQLRAAYIRGNREGEGPARAMGDIRLEVSEEMFELDEGKPQLPESETSLETSVHENL